MTLAAPKSLIPRFFALIPCAGQGTRAVGDSAKHAALPKQYQPIAGTPMVLHTLKAFAGVPRIASCLVVVAPGDSFLDGRAPDGVDVAACGGASRAASVLNGLEQLAAGGGEADDWVLVHDAARCLIAAALIDQLIDACHSDPVGGLLAQPVPDTLKQGQDDRVVATLPREDKWQAQTPQMFRLGALTQALKMAVTLGEAVTDEASAMEAVGLAPKLVRGSAHNFKVTWPEDFVLAEALIKSRTPVKPRVRKAAAPKAVQKVVSDDASHEPI
ncbi:MAG: 2-C-methyl-D-erythritol 4-phosphate cytidylyltransferase [Pseudomonadota bacterium]|uniref:2-C-methyl-D-erythritol 4-phosphate cytidylyltransferase n=1 Tax=Polaromonas sp. TaxID=1869339 RepID=UPI0018241AD2|nr:2-C-methyl-D-erythritol 4-phosphate cytidylyltransferase [Polaromonas sp.]MBA3594242.1 2-C-methyl-D-erythritol 4-phosphate cytidylyltransferase [Polaromonas sp.]MDQ3271770.1 2-C-methyl-D-erythritol 4-phosphate cytidylyltransferase [Pseudomonadota bacterium]